MQTDWFSRLRKWIQQLFTEKPKRRLSPKIIKRWYGNHCAVLRIERSTPGGLATYRVSSPHGSYDYLITLDYLPDLHGEILGRFQGTLIKIPADSSPHTHRFAVWRVFANGSSSPLGVWDVDLEGLGAGSALGQIAPRRAVTGVALLPLSIIHNNKNPLLVWQARMERVDWLGYLEERIREELQNPSHNLKACIILLDEESTKEE